MLLKSLFILTYYLYEFTTLLMEVKNDRKNLQRMRTAFYC
uniref:Uncharacterized protein n=1 Tax=Siphoviridae sp. ctgN495 TaxID=2825608 RepID=A0A8S5UCL9_9CAUD|nr:MAG TPA: hypothetical protein [Siphoviridae sp. ctgN495]